MSPTRLRLLAESESDTPVMTTKSEQPDGSMIEVDGTGPGLDEATLDALMARIEDEGLELLGPDGILTGLTSQIMNR